MSFSIEFLPDRVPDLDTGDPAAYGQITFSDDQERFLASLRFWDTRRYEAQWLDGLRRITKDQTSCLITSITDPRHSTYLFWWPMYRYDGIVHVQNHLLLFNQLMKDFNSDNPYEHIPTRETISENGRQISEWVATLDEIESFLPLLADRLRRTM